MNRRVRQRHRCSPRILTRKRAQVRRNRPGNPSLQLRLPRWNLAPPSRRAPAQTLVSSHLASGIPRSPVQAGPAVALVGDAEAGDAVDAVASRQWLRRSLRLR